MKHRTLALLGLIPLLLLACDVSSLAEEVLSDPTVAAALSDTPVPVATAPATRPNAAASTAPNPTSAPPSSNPVSLRVSTDSRSASTATISPNGGTVRASASDGTRFTLVIPKDALYQATAITLTPVTRADGLPFSGGLVAGVQMAPEGLRLSQPATLTIEPAGVATPAGMQIVGFGYHQEGSNLYLSPMEARGNVVSFSIWHFSGSGIANGTPAEVQAQRQRVPANAEDRLTQAMQEYLSRQRENALRGDQVDPGLADKMRLFLRQFFDEVIAPDLPRALADCDAAVGIFQKALAWERQAALLGLEGEYSAQFETVQKTFEQAIVNCYDRAYEKCVMNFDASQRVVMLGYLRQAALLSPANGGGVIDRLDETKLEKCPPGLVVDEGGNDGQFSGTICALDKPFTLEFASAAGAMKGTYSFSPANKNGGKWSYTGTAAGGIAQNTGSGSYTVEYGKNGPVIRMDAGSYTIVTPMGSGGGAGKPVALTPALTKACGK